MARNKLVNPASRWRGYLAAVLLVVIATALRWALHPILDTQHVYIFIYPTVLLAALACGFGPGVTALGLGVIAAIYLFDPPLNSLRAENAGGFLSALFVMGLILSAGVLQNRARREALRARNAARQHATRLEDEIAQRQRLEESLTQSEERLRLLLESAVDYVIIMLDPRGRIRTWNQGATRLLGWEEHEIIGRSGEIIFTREDQDANRPAQELRLAQTQGRAEDERWHQRKDGTRFWGSGTVAPMRDAHSNIRGFVKIMRDHTSRKQAENALRESEERFRALTELNPNGIIVAQDQRIAFSNAAAARMLGAQTASQIIGEDVFSFVPEEDREDVRRRYKTALTGSPNPPADRHIRRMTGELVAIEAVSAPIPWQGRAAVQINFHDVRERKQYEDSLRRAADLQRLLLRELDHRVRNNLASLISLIDITSSGKSDVREVSIAIRSRTQAMAFVHQLLSKQHWTTVDLPKLIDTLQPPDASGRLRANGPNVAIAARQVTALGMMLQELFSNSSKYGALSVPAGEVTVQWIVRPSRDSDDRILEMMWTERGGPAPHSTQPKKGVGMGLIEGFVRSELRGEAIMGFPQQGATHRFTLRLDPLPQLAQMVG